jgi:hypothetical protein
LLAVKSGCWKVAGLALPLKGGYDVLSSFTWYEPWFSRLAPKISTSVPLNVKIAEAPSTVVAVKLLCEYLYQGGEEVGNKS